jgi:hypothetical protein
MGYRPLAARATSMHRRGVRLQCQHGRYMLHGIYSAVNLAGVNITGVKT